MSFLEKLKKGLGVEIEEEIKEKKPKSEIEKPKKPTLQPKEKIKKVEAKEELETKKIEVETEKKKWFESEGQLAVDVYQTAEDIVVQSAVAGVKLENLEIFVEGDTLTIKGTRERPAEEGERNYFYQECYWGPFSRQIILPAEVDSEKAEALMKEGILTIKIPKIQKEKRKRIIVKG